MIRSIGILVPFLSVLGLLVGCSKDPYTEALLERASWEITPTGVAQGADGTVTVTVDVNGPVHSTLDRLSFVVVLHDESDGELMRHWHTGDLSDVARGVSKELVVRIPAPGLEVAKATVDPVLDPSAEERKRIPELPDPPPAG